MKNGLLIWILYWNNIEWIKYDERWMNDEMKYSTFWLFFFEILRLFYSFFKDFTFVSCFDPDQRV